MDINKSASKCAMEMSKEGLDFTILHRQNGTPQIKAHLCWKKIEILIG
jgi:hypothetical protein